MDTAIQLYKYLKQSQWTYTQDVTSVSQYPILTRHALRSIDMGRGVYVSKSSGSTGEQVSVEKSNADVVWQQALTMRSFEWRGWDTSLPLCVITTYGDAENYDNWGLPKEVFPLQGRSHRHGLDSVEVLQKWIDRKKPSYIMGMPTVVELLDVSNLPDFRASGGTGALGGDIYSSEELGIIAIRCPDVPENMHVSENIVAEVDADGKAILTNLFHPYMKRYLIGDSIVLGECSCGRTLQTITKINGRIRNMVSMPDGTTRWPMTGSKTFYEEFSVERIQVEQVSLTGLRVSIIRNNRFTEDELAAFVKHMQSSMGYDFDIEIVYVDSFPVGKFEEFKNLLLT